MWGSWIHLCVVMSLLQKQSAGSNLKGWFCIHAYVREKYLNKLEKHYFGQLVQPLQPLCEEIAKYCCIASFVQNLSFHNLFHLVQDEVHDEANTCTL